MPGKPPEPVELIASQRSASQATQADGEQQVGERYGPLAIARHVKDDGRVLLLYTREPPAQT